MRSFAFIVFFVAFAPSLRAGELGYDPAEPFWVSKTMNGESLFFVKQAEGEKPSAKLLFTPEKILRVSSATLEVEYVEGKDYIFDKAANALLLPEGSKIPFKTRAEMYPPKGSKQSIGACVDGKSNLFFSEGRVFHDLQTVVTYTHAGTWNGPVTKFAGAQLPGTLAKLKQKEPLSVVLYGDSISHGLNASGLTKAPPFQPPYGQLVVDKLKKVYGSEITFTNPSVPGWSTNQGVANLKKVTDAKPDLVIIAFGMNDASGRMAPEKYSAAITQMMTGIKQAQPNAEFVLVATMLGNPEWTGASPEHYPKFRDELAKLCKEGAVLADCTSMWTELLKTKKIADITGNGVNHPNDFAHRIYAQIITSLLVEK
ncbi:MAG TPA: SGNH/GDSL hydrolase family protein [Planctomycetota bacterium]|nr:SGNH/GDSL hydrolase family protein [Planctomycetota bacterium]